MDLCGQICTIQGEMPWVRIGKMHGRFCKPTQIGGGRCTIIGIEVESWIHGGYVLCVIMLSCKATLYHSTIVLCIFVKIERCMIVIKY